MKYRKGKNSDQCDTEKAYKLLLSLIMVHQSEIDPSLWVGAMVCALAENYKNSEIPFDLFRKDLINAIDHYKY